MKRDIEVAENILATLLKQDGSWGFSNSVEGTYIEGHGAMFTIGNGLHIISGEDVVIFGYGQSYDLKSSGTTKKAQSTSINRDSLQTAVFNKVKNAMKTFLTDYAYLISQLKPNEKILLRYGAANKFGGAATTFYSASLATTASSEKNLQKELTAEVTKATLDDFRNGKLTKAQLEERIKFIEQTAGNERDTELELLSSILNRLYQNDLSKTFDMIGQPSYEKVEGLGAIFNMRFGLLTREVGNNMIYYLRDSDLVTQLRIREKNEHNETSKEDLKKRYNEFLADFSKNVIEYGRTVKALGTNDLFIFKLDMSACPECGIPDKIELSIKKSVLEEYDKNKITLAQAVEKITVKEARN